MLGLKLIHVSKRGHWKSEASFFSTNLDFNMEHFSVIHALGIFQQSEYFFFFQFSTMVYMGNVWDEITYPFLNFNGCTVEV